MDVDIKTEPETAVKDVDENGIIPRADENSSIKTNKQNYFRCAICPYNTFREPFVEKHMMQKHGFTKVRLENRDYGSYSKKMNVENSGYTDKTQLKTNNSFDIIEFQCIKCEFQSGEVTALRNHEKTHKTLSLFSCPNCDYETVQRCNLKAHMRIHENPDNLERFICGTCKKFVSNHNSALLRHIRLKHGTDGIVFGCDVCPFTAKVQRDLRNHQKIHANHDEAPMFKCDNCKSGSFVTYNLQTIQRHVRRHEARQENGEELMVKVKNEEKDIIWFCCSVCEFKSKDQHYMILHKKIHARVDEINN